jgi:hypothetical protein
LADIIAPGNLHQGFPIPLPYQSFVTLVLRQFGLAAKLDASSHCLYPTFFGSGQNQVTLKLSKW